MKGFQIIQIFPVLCLQYEKLLIIGFYKKVGVLFPKVAIPGLRHNFKIFSIFAGHVPGVRNERHHLALWRCPTLNGK